MITINRHQGNDVLTVETNHNCFSEKTFMSVRTLKELDMSGVFIYASDSGGTRTITGSIFRICESPDDKYSILKFNNFISKGFESSGGKAVIK